METAVFAANPPIEAVYENFLGYKCGRSALITELTGWTTFKDFKAADCALSAIEITIPGAAKEDQGKVENAVIVGMSANAGDKSLYTKATGITVGQRDTFLFDNVRFYNINKDADNGSNNAAVGTCSHCAKSLAEEGFGNTNKFKNFKFTDVGVKLRWKEAKFNAILHDIDGSFSGAGAERYVSPW